MDERVDREWFFSSTVGNNWTQVWIFQYQWQVKAKLEAWAWENNKTWHLMNVRCVRDSP